MKMKLTKVKLCILAVLIFGCCLNSCSEESRKEITMQDMYFFRASDGRDLLSHAGTIIKINPTTAAATNVCTDPLCTHDNGGCPLYDIGSAIVSGNILFFTRDSIAINSDINERIGECVFCAYDMQNGTLKELAVYSDSILFLGAADNYCYFTKAIYEETEDGAVTKYLIYRADYKSGKIIELPLERAYETIGGGMSTGDCPNIYAIENDKIYWSAVNFDENEYKYEIYTTNLDGKNKKLLDFNGNTRVFNGAYYQGFSYYNAAPKVDFNTLYGNFFEYHRAFRQNELRRISIDGKNDSFLGDNIGGYVILGDIIYYVVCEDDPELAADINGDKNWNWFGGKIYSMSLDGSGIKLICELDEYNFDSSNISPFVGAVTIDGTDYLALSFREYRENSFYASGMDYYYSPDTLILNVDTGEYVISEYIK